MESKPKKVNDHLANERTFLAWIRTSIAIMGFGFIVFKFSLFVRQISLMIGENTSLPPTGYSATIGIVLVILGMMVTLLAFFTYLKTKKQIETERYDGYSPSVFIITGFIVLISIVLVAYLLKSV